MKVAAAKLALKMNGHSTQAWIDSGSPISFFTIGELKRTLGKQKVQLQQLDSKDDHFRDYGNNPLKLMGKMVATLQFNDLDLMPKLGLMLVQAPAEQGVLNIQK